MTDQQKMRVTLSFDYAVNMDDAMSAYGSEDPYEMAQLDQVMFEQDPENLFLFMQDLDITSVRVEPLE